MVGRLMNKEIEFEKLVTYTSRPKAEDEKDHWDYEFVTKDEFEAKIEEGFFLEHIDYGNSSGGKDYKGTAKESILRVLEGDNVIWRIDMGAAAKVHDILSNNLEAEEYDQLKERVLVVLIGVDSLFDLRARARKRGRGQFDRRRFLDRLRADWRVWQENDFDHIVMNREGQIDEAIGQVRQWVEEKGGKKVLLILTGSTGVGKDTIMNGLLKNEEN
jgi:guanylate kinase